MMVWMAGLNRLTRSEVEVLRRSVAASGQLPRDQLDRLLGETARLLEEQEVVAVALAEIGRPWRDVRVALNELHRIVHGTGTPGQGRSTSSDGMRR